MMVSGEKKNILIPDTFKCLFV